MANYNKYALEIKEKVLCLYLEEGHTKKSLTEEYNLGNGTLTYWLQQRLGFLMRLAFMHAVSFIK